MTPSLRAKGYDLVLTPTKYEALEVAHRASIRARWVDLTDVERIAVMLAEADGVEPRHRARQALAVWQVGFRAAVQPPILTMAA